MILLGMSVWGDYVDKFLHWTLPSLMAPGNLPSIEAVFNIHTDEEGYKKLNHLPYNINFYFDVTKEDKYFQLGKHQEKDLKKAKELKADYHCLMPDFIYSENTFRGIMEASQKHKVIGRLIMSSVQENICPELEKFRYDGVLLIPHITLSTLALKYIHPGINYWLAEEYVYPNIHIQCFEMENTLVMLSPHVSPVFIASDAINLPGDGWPVDSRLDKITNEPIYCTKLEDGICITEITPKHSRKIDNRKLNIMEFALMLRYNCSYSDKLLKLFNEPTIDPINRSMLGKRFHWAPESQKEMVKYINNALNESYSYIKVH